MTLIKDENQDILTRGTAVLRSQVVSDVSYNIYINLDKGKETYCGKVSIQFNYTPHPDLEKLKIDLVTTKLKRCILNDSEIDNFTQEDYAVYFDKRYLEPGENLIEFDYLNTFDNTGSGFHKFKDPVDDLEYMHTDFEPYDAHRLFPSFDQPDIKADYCLTVEGPEEWTYLHNTLPEKINTYLGRKKISFKQTKKFSTYLFALIVGQYTMWEDTYHDIPLGIYCRKSLEQYMDAENIFAITKEAFNLMEEYFDYPYPFDKYDQVFVPEFNFGAMENVGCITFSERFVFRHNMLYGEYLNRANTITHEMVHMWFGDLVTMKWWNDLWLNESFADYLSYYILSKGKLFPDALEHFFVRKEWAYNQDQLSTTHPIASDAEDTIEAFSNFDGISYAKGASVLRQLQYYISDDDFRSAMRTYFKKYEWSNTTLDDFLDLMSQTSGFDIKSWSDRWLLTTGVNTLVPAIKGNTIQVEQLGSKDNDILREHAIEYRGFACEGDVLECTESGKMVIKDQKEEFPLQNSKTTLLVLNCNDYDYVKVYLNEADVDLIEKHLHTIDDSFVRRTIWGSLWHMVRDNKLSPLWFLQIAETLSVRESNSSVLQSHIVSKMISIVHYYLSRENKNVNVPRLFGFAREMLANKSNNDQQQIIWYRLLVTCSESDDALKYLAALLNNEEIINNLEIDQDKRWSIITRLNAYGFEGAEKLINEELLKDSSDLGQKKAFMARVSIPALEDKQAAWKMFTEKTTHSTDYLRYGMQGFQWECQQEILTPFIDPYFADIEAVYRERDVHYAGAFGSNLFPGWNIHESMLEKIDVRLEAADDTFPALLRKNLMEHADMIRRLLPILEKQRS